jgi:hypothetical protein
VLGLQLAYVLVMLPLQVSDRVGHCGVDCLCVCVHTLKLGFGGLRKSEFRELGFELQPPQLLSIEPRLQLTPLLVMLPHPLRLRLL